jgi:DNA invertase Pin-like site-specific DNA recombinase
MIYGYLRVSTDKQDENNQKIGVDEKAVRMGVAIDEYIIDAGVSGTKEPEKRLLGKLMEKLKPGDTIIASEISRLGRSLYMVMRILEFCMKHEVKVITVKDGYELGDNIQSKVLAFAFALSAEIERDMISRRTKEALEKRRRDGIQLGRPKGSRSSCVKLTPHKDEVGSLLQKGISYSASGKILGVHRMTVKMFCVMENIDKQKKFYNGAETPQQKKPLIKALCLEDDVARLIEEGLDYKEIALKLGLSRNAIQGYVQKDFEIYKNYVAAQQVIRIKANGGLHIHKQHGQNDVYR